MIKIFIQPTPVMYIVTTQDKYFFNFYLFVNIILVFFLAELYTEGESTFEITQEEKITTVVVNRKKIQPINSSIAGI